MKSLQQACTDLNAAIDEYWNSDYGIKFTGMAENFIRKITDAQQKCKQAINATMKYIPAEEWEQRAWPNLGYKKGKYLPLIRDIQFHSYHQGYDDAVNEMKKDNA